MLCFSTELLLPTFVFLTRILCFGLYPMQIYLICHNFKHIWTVSLSALTSFNGVWYYEGISSPLLPLKENQSHDFCNVCLSDNPISVNVCGTLVTS